MSNPTTDPQPPLGQLPTQQLAQAAGIPSPGDPGNPNAPTNPNPTAPVNTSVDPSNPNLITVVVNGRPINIFINAQLKPGSSVHIGGPQGAARRAITSDVPGEAQVHGDLTDSVQSQINSIQDWYGNATVRRQIIQQMFDAGLLTTTKNPSAEEVTLAWALVVQEASLKGQITPQELLAKAAQGGWNATNPTLSASDGQLRGTGEYQNSSDTSSQTIYKSYLDPATVMGAQADAWYRLVGRNPTSAEYQAFLSQVYGYQQAENTGKFEGKDKIPGTIDPTTGQMVPQDQTAPGTSTTQTNVVSQRGIGTRGLEFLAGQAALAQPETGPYQAATTYMNAFVKALSGPAAGMSASGPTTVAP